MRFHTYGPVEVAICQGTGDEEPTTLGRFPDDPTIYELRDTGERERDPELQEWVPVERWFSAYANEGRPRVRKSLELADEVIAELLNAGARLCWYEYDRFVEADASMGDPNP